MRLVPFPAVPSADAVSCATPRRLLQVGTSLPKDLPHLHACLSSGKPFLWIVVARIAGVIISVACSKPGPPSLFHRGSARWKLLERMQSDRGMPTRQRSKACSTHRSDHTRTINSPLHKRSGEKAVRRIRNRAASAFRRRRWGLVSNRISGMLRTSDGTIQGQTALYAQLLIRWGYESDSCTRRLSHSFDMEEHVQASMIVKIANEEWLDQDCIRTVRLV